MRRVRAAIVLGTFAALAAGSTVAATTANADPYRHTCDPTAPGFVLGAGHYGADWVTTGRLIDTLQDPDLGAINCRYQGDKYRHTAGTTTKIGTHRWWDPTRHHGSPRPSLPPG